MSIHTRANPLIISTDDKQKRAERERQKSVPDQMKGMIGFCLIFSRTTEYSLKPPTAKYLKELEDNYNDRHDIKATQPWTKTYRFEVNQRKK